jgi:hypothetical protein
VKTEKTSGVLSGAANLIAKNPLKATGVAIAGAGAVRGAIHAGPQAEEVRNQIEAMKHDASTPVRKFAEAWDAKIAECSKRYDDFAQRKLLQKTAAGPETFGQTAMKSFGEPVIKSVAQQLFATPINKAFDILNRKLYLEPRQKNVFQQAIQTDPVLARAMEETPDIVMSAYKTLKQFAPSLTADPASVKNFLRQAVVMGGQVDFATIKLLAETEKNIQASRGKIGVNV